VTRPAQPWPLRGAPGFLIQGHRGARGLFPENTLQGFQAAHASGVTAFELDVQLTADDVVVVTHDPALNPAIVRDPDGAWLDGIGPRIRALSHAALSRYDIGRLRPGSALAALFPEQQPHDGARTPTLEAVLRSLPDAVFNIELKTDPRDPDAATPIALADAVLAVIDRAGAAPRVMLESFDWRGPRHIRRVRPELPLAWLTRAETVRDAHLWWDGPVPADFAGSVARAVAAETAPASTTWSSEFTDLTEAAVQEAHALGLRVLPWTVNRPEDMRRLIAWGVDGLISDRPDRALAVAREAGLSLEG
jgi:glycerophosphoryl diester phosphodiesterase